MWCPHILHPRCQVSSNTMLGLSACKLLSEFYVGFQNSNQHVHQIDFYRLQTCYMAGSSRKLTKFSISFMFVSLLPPHLKQDNPRTEATNFQALILHACFMDFFWSTSCNFPTFFIQSYVMDRAKRWYGTLCWKTCLPSEFLLRYVWFLHWNFTHQLHCQVHLEHGDCGLYNHHKFWPASTYSW